MGVVAVPGLEREHGAHLAVDKRLCALHALVEALHVPDLQQTTRELHGAGEIFDFLDGYADWLFAEHMFARLQRHLRGRNMEGVGRGDYHGVQFGIRKHPRVVGEDLSRSMRDRHALREILGHIAHGEEFGVLGLGRAFEMSRLRDRAAPEDTDPEEPAACVIHCVDNLPFSSGRFRRPR